MKLFTKQKTYIYLFYSIAVIASVGILGLFISFSMSEILLNQSIGYNRQQLASIESGYAGQITHIKSIAERINYVRTGIVTTVYDSIKLLLSNKDSFTSTKEYEEYISHAQSVYAFLNLVENVSQTKAPVFFIAGIESNQGILTVDWPMVNLEKLENARLISDKIFASGNLQTSKHNCIPGFTMPKTNEEYESYYILFEYIRDKYNPQLITGSFVLGFDSGNLNEYINNFTAPLVGTAYVLYSDGTVLFDSQGGTCGNIYRYFDFIKSNEKTPLQVDDKLINFIYNERYDFYTVGEIEKDVLYADINKNNLRLFSLALLCCVIVIFITTRLFKAYSGYISELGSQKALLQQRKAEVKALQFQINPHFLYNTLEVIRMKALTYSDYDTAEMIKMLAVLFRNRVKADIAVLISGEIDYCDSLLYLYSIKYNGEVEVIVDVSDEIRNYGILKDLLQPVLENIFVHAFADLDSYEGCKISLTGRLLENDILFIIENNSKGMSRDILKEVLNNLELETEDDLPSVGLYNVHHRIRLVYGKAYGLSIKSEAETGTAVMIKIAALSLKELADRVKET